jgi:acetyl-CoA acyltransferase
VRSPIGRHGGALSTVRPDDLAAHVLRAVADRAGVDPVQIDDVYMGCANQAGEDNRNVARMASLLAGFPETVPGVTVNRLCGSGLDAVAQAARAIMVGDADVAVGAGVESMSRAPWVVPKASRPFATGPVEMADTTLGWRLVNRRMDELGHTDALGITAENLAVQYGISRSEQDRFALRSQRKAVAATESGRLGEEIVPVEVPVKRGSATITRRAPVSRSIAPPTPRIGLPGTAQLAIRPRLSTCSAPRTAVVTWPPRISPNDAELEK